MALPPPAPASTALITGSSSGIGAEMARGLARRGHGVTVVARRVERLEELVAELSDEFDVRCEFIACDLSQPADRELLWREVADRGLTVEILINNAGYGDLGRFVDADREKLLGMARLNMEAVLDLTARAMPGMAQRGRGAILNVASSAAFQPLPGFGAYAATKAYVLSLTEALHAEGAPAGVTLTALCPGPVPTEFADHSGIDDETESLVPGFVSVPPETVAEQALKGLEQGKRIVTPGLPTRLGAIAGSYAPRWAMLPLLRRLADRVR